MLDANNVCSTKPAASIESHRIRPELCNAFLSLHMNMRWLMSIRGIEEESVWSIAQAVGNVSSLQGLATSSFRMFDSEVGMDYD